MSTPRWLIPFITATALWGFPGLTFAQDPAAVTLPPGVKAVWDAGKAWREATPTRERICVNGLWQWQPAGDNAREVPAAGWGYYKVPASWPGIQDYLESDYQTLYPNPSWQQVNLGQVRAAWYQRTITIPENWAGRHIMLEVEYLNSFASVFLDGREVGQIRFPAGQVDLSGAVRPGATHVLSLLVIAMPLKAVLESYTDTNTARQRQGTVERRGLCGDVWLLGEPPGPRLSEVKIATSVRRSQISFETRLDGLNAEQKYKLRARVTERGQPVAEFTSPAFSTVEMTNQQAAFTASWQCRQNCGTSTLLPTSTRRRSHW